jgi:hypothetical protein
MGFCPVNVAKQITLALQASLHLTVKHGGLENIDVMTGKAKSQGNFSVAVRLLG